MSEEQHESDEATTDDDGNLQVDIEDAGGKELRDVNEKPPEDEIKEIEEERERRLDPDNRPEGAEVDNSDRDFDTATGRFTDSDEYDEGEEAEYDAEADPENVTHSDSDSDSDSEPEPESDSESESESESESADEASAGSDEDGARHRA